MMKNEKETVGESGDPSDTAGLHINHRRVTNTSQRKARVSFLSEWTKKKNGVVSENVQCNHLLFLICFL